MNDKRWTIALVAALVLATLVTSCVSDSSQEPSLLGAASPTSTPNEEGLIVLGPDDALRKDAETYAKQYGITLDEAIVRFQIMQVVSELTAALKANEAKSFGGLWIEHEPEFRVVVLFTHKGKQTVRPYIKGKLYEDVIEVREARYTLAELEAIYAQTARDLEKLDFSVNTMLDVKQNRILIDVGDRAWFEGQLESVGVELDEAVDVIEVEGGATARDMNLLLTPPVPGIAFPRQKPVEGYRMCMTALMIGTLQQEGECLFIQSIWQGNKLLPIWPPEYSLRVEGDQVLVLDAKGEVAVRVGDEVYMGGGGGTPEAWTLQQIPPACRGEYFIVGCEVRPNLKQDAELFDLEMLSDGTHTALFLRYKPALSQQVTEPVSISGLLAYSANHRCPYLQSSSGGNPNLLWPPDWSARLENGVMIVLDAAGQVVARSGEQVSLHGRAIPHSADFPAYGQLINELPGDCMGLTWLVDP